MRFLFALCLFGATAFADPVLKNVPEHEHLSERPSGFWTSNRPVEAGKEYRWTLLYIGIGVAVITGALTVRLVRNVKAPPRAIARMTPHGDK
ncbi:MAG TPA: hypothetical protein VGC41_16245 [Kofleriaceae bacterium]